MLDSQLRVRGIAGLRVVDAGAMPTITSGNTNSPVLMMAKEAAEWIVRDARLLKGAARGRPAGPRGTRAAARSQRRFEFSLVRAEGGVGCAVAVEVEVDREHIGGGHPVPAGATPPLVTLSAPAVTAPALLMTMAWGR